MNDLKASIAALIEVFQFAMVDLSVFYAQKGMAMSAADKESMEVVLGMAAVNSFNLGEIALQNDDYYSKNKKRVDAFITEATEFATSLMRAGFGVTS